MAALGVAVQDTLQRSDRVLGMAGQPRHVSELPRALRALMRGIGALNPNGMQFISYLLFESGFTSDLIELGYRDARMAEDDIRAFLYDRPVGTLDAPGYIKDQMDV